MANNMESSKSNGIKKAAIIGGIIVSVILIFGTMWMGRIAKKDTEDAVRSVSLLYLDELAGRREQVIASNLKKTIDNFQVATGLLEPYDLQDIDHLQAFQRRMKQLYGLEKFAFVDSNGLIYTAQGLQNDIDSYQFDYRALTGPEISIKNIESKNKSVIIAIPLKKLPFNGQTLVASFMEIDMQRMLEGVSLQADGNKTTFCNIYTKAGIPLTNVVLGGLSADTNLLQAMESAIFDSGNSLEKMKQDFARGKDGYVSFTYNKIAETMYYVPIKGTTWMLTYLIRESLISEQISSITNSMMSRNLAQILLTAAVLMAMFMFMLRQMRRAARLELEKETFEAETRVKQQELEQRLSLQEKLLEQEKQRVRQDKMITALASDYRSVYFVDLDTDQSICVRSGSKLPGAPKEGENVCFHELFTKYAEKFVAALEKGLVISYRYLVNRDGKETYEMLRMAGVRHAEDREDHIVHAIGVGFTDVDQETREDMAKNQALSDALTVAEEANKAKTAFLSNMSHEIRTPMNAIIGLDNIALSEKGLSPSTKEYLEKIGDSAQHLLHLINDILDMSRIESGRMSLKNEEFSISHLLEQINTLVSGQCTEKGINYRCNIN